jgi:hypothetical protein
MAQRAERIVFLGVPTLIWGAGPGGWLLLGILAWITVVSWITVLQRVVHVRRITVAAAETRTRDGGSQAVKSTPRTSHLAPRT